MEKGKMRARHIMLYTLCVGIAAPLVMMTGIFVSGPAGISGSAIEGYFAIGAIIAILAGGGISIMGFNFKVPAVLSAYLGLYTGCSTMMVTLTAQMIKPWEVAAIFSGVFGVLFIVVGVFGAMEIAGGPHGAME